MASLGKALAKASGKNYYLRRLRDTWKYWTKPLYREKPLVIYQMGKVGSSTMERTLADYSLERPVYRAHALVKENMQSGRRELGLSAAQYYKRSKLEANSYYLAKEIARARRKKDGDWKVITMVRDPVAQNISSFFQLVDMIIPDFAERMRKNRISTDELLELFLQRYSANCVFNQWFDCELKPVLGIDVFASEFDKQKGYQVYNKDCFSLLLVRLESLNTCAAAAFKEFLELDNFTIVDANKAENKPYSDLYHRFKEEALLPDGYLSGVYDAKYARHFYTEEELTRFRSRYRAS
jgi:hypothetical protein